MDASSMEAGHGERIVVAMSGGVDSSVSAYLLKQQGYDVIGMTMKIWPSSGQEAQGQKSCCGTDAVEDARRVADIVGIPYYVMDMVKEFNEAVIDDFVHEYRAGRTPNPCIRCNVDLKFGNLLERAQKVGAQKVATGHYARVQLDESSGRYNLLRSRHIEKDQSYTLYGLTQRQLSRALFPLGDLTKENVRKLARELNLPTADKPESQDICFVSTGNYRDFLAGHDAQPNKPGHFVDTRGEILGVHDGITQYTVGQRRGLGIQRGKPTYVVKIDPESDTIVLGDIEDLMTIRFIVDPVNWVGIETPTSPIRCQVKIRYGGPVQPGWVNMEGGWALVELDQPHRAVTPGQSAVFYDGEFRVLGGGLITPGIAECNEPGQKVQERQI